MFSKFQGFLDGPVDLDKIYDQKPGARTQQIKIENVSLGPNSQPKQGSQPDLQEINEGQSQLLQQYLNAESSLADPKDGSSRIPHIHRHNFRTSIESDDLAHQMLHRPLGSGQNQAYSRGAYQTAIPSQGALQCQDGSSASANLQNYLHRHKPSTEDSGGPQPFGSHLQSLQQVFEGRQDQLPGSRQHTNQTSELHRLMEYGNHNRVGSYVTQISHVQDRDMHARDVPSYIGKGSHYSNMVHVIKDGSDDSSKLIKRSSIGSKTYLSSQNQFGEAHGGPAEFNNISRISETNNETIMMELENSQKGDKQNDRSEEIEQILKNSIQKASSNHSKSNHMELDSPFDAGFIVGGVVVQSSAQLPKGAEASTVSAFNTHAFEMQNQRVQTMEEQEESLKKVASFKTEIEVASAQPSRTQSKEGCAPRQSRKAVAGEVREGSSFRDSKSRSKIGRGTTQQSLSRTRYGGKKSVASSKSRGAASIGRGATGSVSRGTSQDPQKDRQSKKDSSLEKRKSQSRGRKGAYQPKAKTGKSPKKKAIPDSKIVSVSPIVDSDKDDDDLDRYIENEPNNRLLTDPAETEPLESERPDEEPSPVKPLAKRASKNSRRQQVEEALAALGNESPDLPAGLADNSSSSFQVNNNPEVLQHVGKQGSVVKYHEFQLTQYFKDDTQDANEENEDIYDPRSRTKEQTVKGNILKQSEPETTTESKLQSLVQTTHPIIKVDFHRVSHGESKQHLNLTNSSRSLKKTREGEPDNESQPVGKSSVGTQAKPVRRSISSKRKSSLGTSKKQNLDVFEGTEQHDQGFNMTGATRPRQSSQEHTNQDLVSDVNTQELNDEQSQATTTGFKKKKHSFQIKPIKSKQPKTEVQLAKERQKQFADQQLRWKELRDQKIFEAQVEKEYEENMNVGRIQFRNTKSHKMLENTPSLFDNSYYQATVQRYWDKQFENELKKMEKDEIDREEYTFKPQISNNTNVILQESDKAQLKNVSTHARTYDLQARVEERLFKWKEDVTKKKEDLLNSGEKKFNYLSEMSKRYLVNSENPRESTMKNYSNTEKHQRIQNEAEVRFKKEVQDKPKIDKKSKKIALGFVEDESMKNKPAHERLYENKIYQRDKSEDSSERKSAFDPTASKAKIDNFLDRNYKNWQKESELKTKALQAKKEEREQKLMVGSGLSKGTKYLMERKYGESEKSIPTFEKLYKEATLLKSKKDRMIQLQEEKKAEKEMEDVTFKPKINSPLKDKFDDSIYDDPMTYTSKTGDKLGMDSLSSTMAGLFPAAGSYLEKHLSKKKNDFVKQKESSEKQEALHISQISELSKVMLQQVQKQKEEISAYDSASKQQDDEGGAQFEAIENFLVALAKGEENLDRLIMGESINTKQTEKTARISAISARNFGNLTDRSGAGAQADSSTTKSARPGRYGYQNQFKRRQGAKVTAASTQKQQPPGYGVQFKKKRGEGYSRNNILASSRTIEPAVEQKLMEDSQLESSPEQQIIPHDLQYSPEKMPVKYTTNQEKEDPIIEAMKANRSNIQNLKDPKSKHNFKFSQQKEPMAFNYAQSFTEESKQGFGEEDSDAELIAEAKKAILEFEQFRLNQDGEVEPASLKKLQQLKEFVQLSEAKAKKSPSPQKSADPSSLKKMGSPEENMFLITTPQPSKPPGQYTGVKSSSSEHASTHQQFVSQLEMPQPGIQPPSDRSSVHQKVSQMGGSSYQQQYLLQKHQMLIESSDGGGSSARGFMSNQPLDSFQNGSRGDSQQYNTVPAQTSSNPNLVTFGQTNTDQSSDSLPNQPSNSTAALGHPNVPPIIGFQNLVLPPNQNEHEEAASVGSALIDPKYMVVNPLQQSGATATAPGKSDLQFTWAEGATEKRKPVSRNPLIENTGPKGGLSNLTDQIGLTPDTDLRKDLHFTESPDAKLDSNYLGSMGAHLRGPNDGGESSSAQSSIVLNMNEMSSPSPLKIDDLKNKQPDFKPAANTAVDPSFKPAFSIELNKVTQQRNDSNEIKAEDVLASLQKETDQQQVKTTVVESLDDIFPRSSQQTRPEDTAEASRSSTNASNSSARSKKDQGERATTNQIQIEENTLDDDEEIEIADPLADKMKEFEAQEGGSGNNSARARENSGNTGRNSGNNSGREEEEKEEEFESPVGSSPSQRPGHRPVASLSMIEEEDNEEDTGSIACRSLSFISSHQMDNLRMMKTLSANKLQQLHREADTMSSPSPVNRKSQFSKPSAEKNEVGQQSASFAELEVIQENPKCPDIVRDIIKIEKDFIKFIEKIYD